MSNTKQEIKLDPSWAKQSLWKNNIIVSEHLYLDGASDFQKKAIEELEKEKQDKQISASFADGFEYAIQIIANLKAK